MAELEHDPRYEAILAARQVGENWEALRLAEALRNELEQSGEPVPEELHNWINEITLEGTEANEGDLLMG
jgi:hypothetical protein